MLSFSPSSEPFGASVSDGSCSLAEFPFLGFKVWDKLEAWAMLIRTRDTSTGGSVREEEYGT